jgi:hypothetical protein
MDIYPAREPMEGLRQNGCCQNENKNKKLVVKENVMNRF